MNRSSILLFLILIGCSANPRSTYENFLNSPDLYASCLVFLSENDSFLSLTDKMILDQLKSAAKRSSNDTYFTGEIVFDTTSKEGKHLQLDRFGRIEYFRFSPMTLEAKEGMEFLCAEHIRWILERKFRDTAKAIKTDPKSKAAIESSEKNLEEYLKFSHTLRNKSRNVRNFLFLSLNRYIAGDQGFPIFPCRLSKKMKDPILIATKDLEDMDLLLTWAFSIQTITAYEFGFTLAGYCN